MHYILSEKNSLKSYVNLADFVYQKKYVSGYYAVLTTYYIFTCPSIHV